jgi:Zn finger protein HypA/HybF involved in hydrogenase expression
MAEYKSPIAAYECKECEGRVESDEWNDVGFCPNCGSVHYYHLTDADLKVEILEREVEDLREQLDCASFGGAVRYGIPY